MRRIIMLFCLSLAPITISFASAAVKSKDTKPKSTVELKTNDLSKKIRQYKAPGHLRTKPAILSLKGGFKVTITDRRVTAARHGKRWFSYRPTSKGMIAFVRVSNSNAFIFILLADKKRFNEAKKNPRPDNLYMAWEYASGARIIDFKRKRVLDPHIVMQHWITRWSPNGRYLAFTTSSHGPIHIFDAKRQYKTYKPMAKVRSGKNCGALYKSSIYWISDSKLRYSGTSCMTHYTYIYNLVTKKSVLDSSSPPTTMKR